MQVKRLDTLYASIVSDGLFLSIGKIKDWPLPAPLWNGSRSRSHVSSSRGHWYTYACTLIESKSLIYTLVCSRETKNLDCTFAELGLHPNRPLKDQPFSQYFRKAVISRYTRPELTANVKTLLIRVLLRLSKLDGKSVFICDFFLVVYLMFHYQI